jgi:hypothetical protein
MLKAWVRGIGIVSVLVGILSFKFMPGINPIRDLSLFGHKFTSLGELSKQTGF